MCQPIPYRLTSGCYKNATRRRNGEARTSVQDTSEQAECSCVRACVLCKRTVQNSTHACRQCEYGTSALLVLNKWINACPMLLLFIFIRHWQNVLHAMGLKTVMLRNSQYNVSDKQQRNKSHSRIVRCYVVPSR